MDSVSAPHICRSQRARRARPPAAPPAAAAVSLAQIKPGLDGETDKEGEKRMVKGPRQRLL